MNKPKFETCHRLGNRGCGCTDGVCRLQNHPFFMAEKFAQLGRAVARNELIKLEFEEATEQKLAAALDDFAGIFQPSAGRGSEEAA